MTLDDLAKLTPAQALRVIHRRATLALWLSGFSLALSTTAIALRLFESGCLA